ncbi:MAG: VWA domain-containing protein, partial [Gammaproteobacteria bacterium]
KKTLRALLQETWQKLLDEEYAKWELEKIAEYRRALLEELQNALELIQQLADALEALSIEPGLLFDLSKDNISLSDIEKIKRWANYLSQDENVRRLCEMLGRMRTAAGVKRREIIMSSETIPAVHVDANSKEEIAGVCAGNDIEYALPQEKALLADEDTALLFDLKFAERRLMQFDMTGSEIYDLTEEKEKETEISEKEKTGPVIVCVDTSGSMKGAPETVAKAVSLYMAAAAMKQKRDCYLINFSTGIKTLDLSGRQSIAGLLKFLRLSFGGGTDAAPAIAHALQMMQTKNYKKADLLIVSDFMMDELPAALHPQIAAAKENGNKFHSLSIGGNFLRQALKDLFDNEWAYNPQNGGVRQLLDCADLAGGQKYL